MESPSTPPKHVTAAAMYHLGGAMRQLRSFSADGPTVYALTVFGIGRDAFGAASLAGPALDGNGTAAGWPAEAREAAAAIFRRPAARRAGTVTVIVIVQIGRVSHCTYVNIPGEVPRRQRRASSQASCRDALAAAACV